MVLILIIGLVFQREYERHFVNALNNDQSTLDRKYTESVLQRFTFVAGISAIKIC